MRKKTSLIIISIICMLSILAGCFDSGTVQIDKSRTQLYVSNFDGGIGTEWLNNIKAEFEAKYADTEFEPGSGKKGVEIVISAGKENAAASLATSRYEVFFTELVFYNDLISQGNLLEITDIVTENLPGEDKSIEDKLTDAQKDAFTALNGKHYVLPHYEVYSGITYDIDLFYVKGLFIKEGGGYSLPNAITAEQRAAVDATKSKGPDGKANTTDDGLPATYEEFFELCDRMKNFNVTPFIWKGEGYPNKLVQGIWCAYTGADEFYLNVNFGGGKALPMVTEIVTGFNGNEPIIQEIEINERNAYLLNQQAGKYYGYEFLSKIFNNTNYYSDKGLNEAFSHLDVQTEYIYSSLENNPIAMMIEGNYWYNEASESFKRSVNTFGTKAQDRNFGWMSLPRAVSGEVEESNMVLCDSLSSFAFINANIADNPNQVALAKLFLQYCYKDSSLQNFTTTTGMAKGVKYQLTDAQYEGMEPYFQNMYDIRQESEIIYPYSSHQIFIYNQGKYTFDNASPMWESQMTTGKYGRPLTAYKNNVTAKDYFMGGWSTQASWTTLYSRYFTD